MKYIDGRDETDKEATLESPEYYDDLSKNVNWYHRVLLNQPLKVGLAMIIIAIVAPVLIYFYLYEGVEEKKNMDGFSVGTCAHLITSRLQCGPDNITIYDCDINCCYDEDDSFCYHRMPSRFSYVPGKENGTWKPRFPDTPYGGMTNIPRIKLFINEISRTHVNFVLYDPEKIKDLGPEGKVDEKTFNFTVYEKELNIEVFSLVENITKPLFSTARGPLIVTEDILEWSFQLSDDHLYGMGELILNSKPPEMLYNVRNRTSTMPFVMGHRNGSFHGIYIQSEGPVEFTVTDSKLISVKSFSTDSISVHFFHGNRPREVLEQFSEFVGRSRIPPYWSLGVHFCRNETTSKDVTVAIESFMNFTSAAIEENMPYDSDCIGDELFQDVNFDENLMEDIKTAVDILNKDSRNFLPSIRPHMKFNDTEGVYDSALEAGILLLDPFENETIADEPYRGISNDRMVVYPDYSLQETREWFSTRPWPFAEYTSSFMLKDNWPNNERNVTNCTVHLPYIRDDMYARLCQSIPWNVRVPNTNETHMKNHNLYGTKFSEVIVSTIPMESNGSTFIMSSSLYPGNSSSGFHAQNVELSWKSMKQAFQRAVANSMAGSYMQSVPVCGDSNNSTEKNVEALCLKWYLTSISLPTFHVHSNSIKRYPFAFSGFAKKAMLKALETRYRLLPYYYTTLSHNEPLLRGMYYEFLDEDALDLEDQFMIGEAVMIAPEFSHMQTSVNVYFPQNETWYDLWGGEEIFKSKTGWMNIPALETDIPMFLRAGFIVPIQETYFSTANQRRIGSPYTLIIGLNCNNGTNCHSSGSIFIEDFAEVNMYATNTTLTISGDFKSIQLYVCGEGKISSSVIDRIRVYGLDEKNNNSNDKTHYYEYNLEIDICKNVTDPIYEHNYTFK